MTDSRISSQAYLAAGMQTLDFLRGQLLVFLELKEQEVLARMAAGEAGQVADPQAENISEWLS